MTRPCYMCLLGKHDACVDVNCLCLVCCLENKEEYPMVWPTKLPYLPTCSLN
jgi:hypothetical protein